MPSLRPVAACVLPALVIALAWASIEEPRRIRDALVVAAFALTPALVTRTWLRGVAAAVAAVGVWIAFGARPWELELRQPSATRARNAIERGNFMA